jgi:hypothetical protein
MNRVGILLIAERVRGRIRGVTFEEGNDFSLSAMRRWEDANAIRLGERASLMLLLAIVMRRRCDRDTHLASRNPRLCLCTPTCYQEAQGVTSTEQDTSEEGPLLTFYPIVVLDVVRIGQQRVEWEERDSIQVLPARYGDT